MDPAGGQNNIKPNKGIPAYLENEDILNCLTEVFFGFDLHATPDEIKILLTHLTRKPVPIIVSNNVNYPEKPEGMEGQPVQVFSNRTRKRGRDNYNRQTLKFLTPFTDFMNKYLLTARIDKGSITFIGSDKHIEGTVPLTLIGEGSYGKVYMLELEGRKYIIKEDKYLRHKEMPEDIEDHYRTAFREAFINVVLQHDTRYGAHVGRLIKVLRNGNNILFMIEHIDNTLEQYIKKENDALQVHIDLATVDTNPLLIDFLRNIGENKNVHATINDIDGSEHGYDITHNTKEDMYPYTFKVFYKGKVAARLRLVEGRVEFRKEKIQNAKGPINNPEKVNLDDDKRIILQNIILAIESTGTYKDQPFLYPIFHTLGAVLEYFRDTYGFYHRDLHKGNIMITNDGKLKLIDFGMSYMRGMMEREEPERYDFLVLACNILEYDEGSYGVIKSKLLSLFDLDGRNIYPIFQSLPSSIFHEVYYYKMDNPRSIWNLMKSRNGRRIADLFISIAEKFRPERFKALWGEGEPEQYAYDTPCDMAVILKGMNSKRSKLSSKAKLDGGRRTRRRRKGRR